MPDVRKSKTFVAIVRDRLGTALVTALVGLILLFPNTLIDRVKFALTKTTLREDRYVKIADELSAYLSAAEFVQQELANYRTTKDDLDFMLNGQGGYNPTVVALVSHQYSDRAIIARYWNKDTAKEFEALMQTVTAVDGLVHSLNGDFEKVKIASEKHAEQSAPQVDKARAENVASQMQPLNNKLKAQVLQLLAKP